MSSIPSLICVALFLSFNFGYVFFCSLLMLCVVHAETLTKGSLLPNQERRFLWCYCVQLRNRNAISHVLKLFGLFLVRRAVSSRICFVRPSRPSLSRVFYVTLTAEQAESVEKVVGRANASARFFFAVNIRCNILPPSRIKCV